MTIKPIESFVEDDFPGQYPEDDDLHKFIRRRKNSGRIWLMIFMASTIVAIIALSALIYTIVRDSFGYIVGQNTVDPHRLVIQVEEARMLTASNTVSSEDDTELVAGIADDPYAIGYFGYAYYTNNDDKLRAVAVNGSEPSAESAENGAYPYARPLFIYSASSVMEDNPEAAGFVNFYLNNVNDVIEEIGYFPVSQEGLEQARQAWLAANDMAGQPFPEVDPAGLGAGQGLEISGSSTVYPVSRQLAINFRRAGYQGGIDIQQTGTSAGFDQFCASGGIDIADASRPINRPELETCQKARREPVEFKIGNDALAIAVSQQNDFLQDVTVEQLREIFTDYERWSEVDPSFPDEPIRRYIPGADSGTLDFFTEETFARGLDELTPEELIALLEFHLSAGRVAALNAQQPLAERTQPELVELVEAEIVKPRVVQSYNLVESIFSRDEVYAYAETVPNSYVEFRNWLSLEFLTTPQSSTPEYAGIRTAILGSLWVIAITIIVALPLGVGAAIYLEEYATMVANPTLRRLNAIIQTNINNLAGVPSIIYGLLGLAVFVRALEPITSGTAFGVADPTTANGRTIVSAGLTLALLILPIIIINAQEAIRAVPNSLRQAGMGLGATRWQTIRSHVLPNAIPGILTGNILAISRAIGETAPLVVVGVSTFITVDPTGPFSKFTTLPAQIYQWTSRPQDEFRFAAAAAIIVLLVLLLSLNAAAVLLRNKYSKKLI
jgi:phosphate transport system permease protein